ncbi:MAG: acetyl-CoA carboxylase biotin carboxyl carrier protein subunit [Chloroflexi bacterium]|nr:acetyl-CoA carboxylase biotin carboxyl carrier protein subunit [Chloroflexota bacterium]
MAAYRVLIGKREYIVEISDDQLLVNGEKEQVNLIPLNGGGLYLLRRGDQSKELHVQSQGRRRYDVTSDGRRVVAQVVKDRGQCSPWGEQNHLGDLLAPMPGMVVSIKAREGERVEQGQVLVVLESMKMQMELRSPVSGLVSKMPIQFQSQVDKGVLLARVDQA